MAELADVLEVLRMIAGGISELNENLARVAEIVQQEGGKRREKKARRGPGELNDMENRLIEEWNKMAKRVNLATVSVLTSTDQKNFRERLADLKRSTVCKGDDNKALQELFRILWTIPTQPFAIGRVAGKPWKITLGMFLKAEKFANVGSRVYGEEAKAGQRTDSDGSVRDDTLFE